MCSSSPLDSFNSYPGRRGFFVKALLSIVEERLLKPKELKPPKVDYQNFLDLLNERVAASQYEGNPDPSIIRIPGFQLLCYLTIHHTNG